MAPTATLSSSRATPRRLWRRRATGHPYGRTALTRDAHRPPFNAAGPTARHESRTCTAERGGPVAGEPGRWDSHSALASRVPLAPCPAAARRAPPPGPGPVSCHVWSTRPRPAAPPAAGRHRAAAAGSGTRGVRWRGGLSRASKLSHFFLDDALHKWTDQGGIPTGHRGRGATNLPTAHSTFQIASH